MLTLQIPMLLALLGTALMAVVIFAPSRDSRAGDGVVRAAAAHRRRWSNGSRTGSSRGNRPRSKSRSRPAPVFG